MLTLIRKEINGFLNSLIGYLAVIVFLLTISLVTWIFPETEFNIPEAGYASIDPLFIITPWVYMFLVPAITMRLFSEEKKSGTIELLLTRPLTEMQVVLAKYFSGVVLVLFSICWVRLQVILIPALCGDPMRGCCFWEQCLCPLEYLLQRFPIIRW